MERIALLGYLYKYQDQTQKFNDSKYDFHTKAMLWAKKNLLEHWMKLYCALSKFTNAQLHGEAGYIFDNNPIGEAIRNCLYPTSREQEPITDELLLMAFRGLGAAYTLIPLIFENKTFSSFPEDINLVSEIAVDEIRALRNYLIRVLDNQA